MTTPADPTAELFAELANNFGKPCDAEKIQACIAAGARLDAADGGGHTALHKCIAHCRDVDTVRALIAAGAPLEAKNDKGLTALAAAAWSGRTDIALALIQAKADVNATSVEGSPLALAMNCGYKPIARAMILAGAAVDVPLKGGSTPLMLAVIHKMADIADMLLKRGADPDRPRGDGKTPYGIAINSSSPIADMIRREKMKRAVDAAARALTEREAMVEGLGAAVHAGTENPIAVKTLRLKSRPA